MKLYNTKLINRDNTYFVGGHKSEKPELEPHRTNAEKWLIYDLEIWQSSYIEIEVHESEENNFINIIPIPYGTRLDKITEMLKEGISIPHDRVEVRKDTSKEYFDDNDKSIGYPPQEYAFLVEEPKEETVIWASTEIINKSPKKCFYESDVKTLFADFNNEKISFGKLVEWLNEKANSFIPESKEEVKVDNQDELWNEIFTDLDKWSRTMKSSFDTPIKIKELTSKFTITKR
jgi:hypothetical protein